MKNREWWLKMAEKARQRWQNYAFQMYYMEIEEYCRIKAIQK
jgi:hypothetical protein|tara:strand:+ start:1509 stop:1634 length:126 start_codon:yes stop_codon:yes gene_type:complete